MLYLIQSYNQNPHENPNTHFKKIKESKKLNKNIQIFFKSDQLEVPENQRRAKNSFDGSLWGLTDLKRVNGIYRETLKWINLVFTYMESWKITHNVCAQSSRSKNRVLNAQSSILGDYGPFRFNVKDIAIRTKTMELMGRPAVVNQIWEIPNSPKLIGEKVQRFPKLGK